jgi:hypothetical protein
MIKETELIVYFELLSENSGYLGSPNMVRDGFLAD